jgi:hypothetical protein
LPFLFSVTSPTSSRESWPLDLRRVSPCSTGRRAQPLLPLLRRASPCSPLFPAPSLYAAQYALVKKTNMVDYMQQLFGQVHPDQEVPAGESRALPRGEQGREEPPPCLALSPWCFDRTSPGGYFGEDAGEGARISGYPGDVVSGRCCWRCRRTGMTPRKGVREVPLFAGCGRCWLAGRRLLF